MTRTSERVFQAAVARKLVPHTARFDEKADALSMARALALEGRVPIESLYRALAAELDLPYVDLERCRPARHLAERLPRALLRRSRVLPFVDDLGNVYLATADPGDRNVLEAARRALGPGAEVSVLEPEALDRLIDSTIDDGPQEAEAVDAPALLERLLLEAYLHRASDIHLEPEGDSLRVRIRTDGALRIVLEGMARAERMALVSRVKVLAGLDIAEQRVPQDGSFRYEPQFLPGRALEIRVASMPTDVGERLTLRLLGIEDTAARLEELGLEAEDLELLRVIVRRSSGLVLIAGATGSGKTTTLYSALAEVDRRRRNVLTVEDPIERRLPSITQVRVGGGEKVTFPTALRAFLRHDPDVILVGEIRDAETADAALKAAMTGHLVLSTVHTGTAAGAVGRLFDLGTEPYRVATSLKLVVAQRLVRRLCVDCRRTRAPTEVERDFLEDDAPVSYSSGCPRCVGTGSHGRIGLFEMLTFDRGLARSVAARRTGAELELDAGPLLRPLSSDARRKARAGIISATDALEAVMDRE